MSLRNYYNKDVYHSLVPIDSTSERSVSNSFRVTTLIHNNNKIPNKICPAFSNLLYTDDYQTRTYTISYHLYNTSVLTRNILDLSKYKSISNNSQPPPLSRREIYSAYYWKPAARNRVSRGVDVFFFAAAVSRHLARENDADLIIVRIVVPYVAAVRQWARAIRRHCSWPSEHSDTRRSRPT